MRSLLFSFALVACAPPDPEHEPPPICTTESTSPAIGDIHANVTYDASAGTASIALSDSIGWIELTHGETLELIGPGATPIALGIVTDGCEPAHYDATPPAADMLIVRLSNAAGFEKSSPVEIDRVGVSDVTTRAGDVATLELDADVPAISGADVGENWAVELRGSCVTTPDHALAEDPNGFGSQQAMSVDGKLAIRIPTSAVTVPAGGCDIAATFVTTVTTHGNTLAGTFIGISRTPFTIHVDP